jgi:hypothetical protein
MTPGTTRRRVTGSEASVVTANAVAIVDLWCATAGCAKCTILTDGNPL